MIPVPSRVERPALVKGVSSCAGFRRKALLGCALRATATSTATAFSQYVDSQRMSERTRDMYNVLHQDVKSVVQSVLGAPDCIVELRGSIPNMTALESSDADLMVHNDVSGVHLNSSLKSQLQQALKNQLMRMNLAALGPNLAVQTVVVDPGATALQFGVQLNSGQHLKFDLVFTDQVGHSANRPSHPPDSREVADAIVALKALAASPKRSLPDLSSLVYSGLVRLAHACLIAQDGIEGSDEGSSGFRLFLATLKLIRLYGHRDQLLKIDLGPHTGGLNYKLLTSGDLQCWHNHAANVERSFRRFECSDAMHVGYVIADDMASLRKHCAPSTLLHFNAEHRLNMALPPALAARAAASDARPPTPPQHSGTSVAAVGVSSPAAPVPGAQSSFGGLSSAPSAPAAPASAAPAPSPPAASYPTQTPAAPSAAAAAAAAAAASAAASPTASQDAHCDQPNHSGQGGASGSAAMPMVLQVYIVTIHSMLSALATAGAAQLWPPAAPSPSANARACGSAPDEAEERSPAAAAAPHPPAGSSLPQAAAATQHTPACSSSQPVPTNADQHATEHSTVPPPLTAGAPQTPGGTTSPAAATPTPPSQHVIIQIPGAQGNCTVTPAPRITIHGSNIGNLSINVHHAPNAHPPTQPTSLYTPAHATMPTAAASPACHAPTPGPEQSPPLTSRPPPAAAILGAPPALFNETPCSPLPTPHPVPSSSPPGTSTSPVGNVVVMSRLAGLQQPCRCVDPFCGRQFKTKAAMYDHFQAVHMARVA